MAKVLKFRKKRINSLSKIRERGLLETISAFELLELGIGEVIYNIFPLSSFSKETRYFIGSVISALDTFKINDFDSSMFSRDIHLDDLVNLDSIDGMKLNKETVQRRLNYLETKGIITIRNRTIDVNELDIVLKDLLGATSGNLVEYDSKIVPIRRYYSEEDNFSDMLKSKFKIKLKRREFRITKEIYAALKKLEMEVPDIEPYLNKMVLNFRKGSNGRISEKRRIDEITHFGKGKNPNLGPEPNYQTSDDDSSFLEVNKKSSKEIIDYANENLTLLEIGSLIGDLNSLIGEDIGICRVKMQKAIKEIGGFNFYPKTNKKDDFVEAYRNVISTFYPINIYDLYKLLHYRACKSFFSLDYNRISELILMCKPIEFMEELFFSQERVKKILDDELPDLDEIEFLPLGYALSLIREYEEIYNVKRINYIAMGLVERLPKYSVVETETEKSIVSDKTGALIKKEEFEDGVRAVMKHVYHVPEFRYNDTNTSIGLTYWELDPCYKPFLSMYGDERLEINYFGEDDESDLFEEI
ncbi:hypothetical protein J4459_01850 [Candidatus Woesearchaeota archaeon]|nr:hypothetical protein [Candidatus Woesearchaeota archaeon]